ncbi:MAG: alpha-galactosidase, partial [Eggerthellaceae bacterium]|nr:alpha-galactosidase [Eggerthellaceae bacterium]
EGLSAGLQRIFQIDDGWCKVGDWLEPLPEKFPGGMAPLAAAIRDAGFTPGLWLAPFVCQLTSRLFTERHDWLLRDRAGSIMCTGSHWGGAYALDVRKPEVREYVRRFLGTAVEGWGFELLKLDFLYAACLEPADGATRGEVMREAMELLREAVGEECLLDGCGVPLSAAFGLVDYYRIGCDVGLTWDDNLVMRQLHRERVSTKHALGNVRGRSPLDGRAFGNDPDVIFLRGDVKLSRAQQLELLDAASKCGSMLLTSDDMGKWTDADLAAYLEAVRVLCGRKAGR